MPGRPTAATRTREKDEMRREGGTARTAGILRVAGDVELGRLRRGLEGRAPLRRLRSNTSTGTNDRKTPIKTANDHASRGPRSTETTTARSDRRRGSRNMRREKKEAPLLPPLCARLEHRPQAREAGAVVAEDAEAAIVLQRGDEAVEEGDDRDVHQADVRALRTRRTGSE